MNQWIFFNYFFNQEQFAEEALIFFEQTRIIPSLDVDEEVPFERQMETLDELPTDPTVLETLYCNPLLQTIPGLQPFFLSPPLGDVLITEEKEKGASLQDPPISEI